MNMSFIWLSVACFMTILAFMGYFGEIPQSHSQDIAQVQRGTFSQAGKPVLQEDDQIEIDRKLKARVQTALRGGYFSTSFSMVVVDVVNGHVTLRGVTENARDKREALRRVQDVPGIRTLTDEISVVTPKIDPKQSYQK